MGKETRRARPFGKNTCTSIGANASQGLEEKGKVRDETESVQALGEYRTSVGDLSSIMERPLKAGLGP